MNNHLVPQLECASSEVICPFTELSLFERLSQNINQNVQVISHGRRTSGALVNIRINGDDISFSVKGRIFRFSKIEKLILLEERNTARGFMALLQLNNSKTRRRVRLINIASNYVEIIKLRQQSLIPRNRVREIICTSKPFMGVPENITVAQRLRPLIGSEIGVQVPPRNPIPTGVILTDVTTDSVFLRDETGTIHEINYRTTPVLFEIPGQFTPVLTLVTVESTQGEIDLTLNLNRLGLDFIEASIPQPPFLYFLIPLNPLIDVDCVENEE